MAYFDANELIPMQAVFDELNVIIERVPTQLEQVNDPNSAKPGEWSKKEILGHLIDSASNNHLRFVRAQIDTEVRLPSYEQEEFVKAQNFSAEDWQFLINLWKSYNTHLLHVMKNIPPDKYECMCFIGDNPPVTLEFVMQDYVGHLKHHLSDLVVINEA